MINALRRKLYPGTPGSPMCLSLLDGAIRMDAALLPAVTISFISFEALAQFHAFEGLVILSTQSA
jgi:hypothetical protein